MPTINPEHVSPCGLYCGVCAILIAHRDDNARLKERLIRLYQGGTVGKGTLPGAETLTADGIRCGGCRSQDLFLHCRQCGIRACVDEKGIAGCHECGEFPCGHIDAFPMTVGKKVILRAVPRRREVGDERWLAEEEARYHCPECGLKAFRGAMTCPGCKAELDLD